MIRYFKGDWHGRVVVDEATPDRYIHYYDWPDLSQYAVSYFSSGRSLSTILETGWWIEYQEFPPELQVDEGL